MMSDSTSFSAIFSHSTPSSPRLNSQSSISNPSAILLPSSSSPRHTATQPQPSPHLIYSPGQSINCFSYSPVLSRIVIGGKDIRLLAVTPTSLTPLRNNHAATATTASSGSFSGSVAGSSISDLCFHPTADLLLAAPTSGRFLVYKNLEKDGFKRPYREYSEHERTVNRSGWIPTIEGIAVSASQDGSVKLWDINSNDKTSRLTLQSTSSVRDIALHPSHPYLIAAAYENGSIHLWDTRKSNQSIVAQVFGHTGLILTLDWHPTERHTLASGGIDRFIRVWSTISSSTDTGYNFSLLHSIQTIASVGRLKWRPNHRYQLASAASQVDFTVHLWNLHSPFIPLASSIGHRDAITGLAWADDDQFWSVSKDSTLRHHSLNEAVDPRLAVPTVALSWNIKGDLAIIRDSTDKSNYLTGTSFNNMQLFPNSFKYYNYNVNKHFHPPLGRITLFNHFDAMYHHYKVDPPTPSSPSTTEPEADTSTAPFSSSPPVSDSDALIECALSYRLTGSLRGICRHNINVCEKVKRPYLVQMWKMIEILYGEEEDERIEKRRKEKAIREQKRLEERNRKEKEKTGITLGKMSASSSAQTNNGIHPTIASGQDSFLLSDKGKFVSSKPYLCYSISAGLSSFEQSGKGKLHSSSPPSNPFHYDPSLPSALSASDYSSPSSRISPHLLSSLPIIPLSFAQQTPISSTLSFKNRLMLDFLQSSCNQGDIQTCVVVSLVLQRFLALSHAHVRPWLFAYLVLLQRLELFSVATELLSLSDDSELISVNNTSTTIALSCPWCRAASTRVGHVCECEKVMSRCSVCTLPVRGLFVWCQGCGHGGHSDHMEEWFKQYSYCPAGCLHKCKNG